MALTDSASGPVTAWDRWLARRLLARAGGLPLSVLLWNGEEQAVCETKPRIRVRIRERRALHRLALNPELGFGDCYSEGLIEIDGDLVEFLESYHRAHARDRRRPSFFALDQRFHSLERSRRNAYHHYDVGNDFYALWLDQDYMQYTCAYFPEPSMSLEEAQVAKMRHICRKLGLRPGQSVVEAGCGWGGFARFMAKHYLVKVRAYNVSREQVAFARRRAAALGLADQVEYVEDDYRNITGTYDAFVSVGMLEHVGIENYPVLGRVIDRCLRPQGKGLIHAIGRNSPGRLNAWIERRIFPGARPPSLGQMAAIFEPRSFSVLDVENLRLHYAETARHWLGRFQAQEHAMRSRYSEALLRAWRLYLAGTVAGFSTGVLQLFQVLFCRQEMNDLPWSRKHLYDESSRELHGKL